MLPNHKIKMAAYYVKNKKCFRRHLGLICILILAWQQCFYFYILALELPTYQKMRTFYSAVVL
jgi:hypothetical protein